jgi:predicted nucleic acid-binding protein
VSEDGGATPAPYVLDVSVLTAITRGDYGIMTFILGLDASGQPLVIPALAIAGASLDLRSDDTEAILHGLERLESVLIAPLRDAEQAVRLAAVIAKTGLDPWDAHAAAVADAAICPILTLNAARWREHAADMDEPLHLIEIAEPDEPPGGPGPGALGARGGTRFASPWLPAAPPACFLHRAGLTTPRPEGQGSGARAQGFLFHSRPHPGGTRNV